MLIFNLFFFIFFYYFLYATIYIRGSNKKIIGFIWRFVNILTEFGNAKIDNKGYYYITTRKEGNHSKRLHRLIWEKEYGAIPDGYVIHHKDFDTTNNSLDNLEMLTDFDHRSLHKTGVNHPMYGKRGKDSPNYGNEPWCKGKKRPEHSERMTGEGNPQYGKTGENSTNYGKEPWNKGIKCPQISEANKGKKRPNVSKMRIEKGLAKGENNPKVKITTVIARTIKFLLFYTTLTHQEIADGIPGATKGIVSSINRGITWKDVELHNQRFYNVE